MFATRHSVPRVCVTLLLPGSLYNRVHCISYINLALIVFLVYLFLFLCAGPSVESKDVSKVDETLLDQVEADVYWCLTKLLDNIQVRRGEKRSLLL